MTQMNATDAAAATIRSAAAGDLEKVEALLTASGVPVEGVREVLPTFVVAEYGDAIVGVAGLELCCDNPLLRSVAVADDWRSHGLGRALVTRIISDAEARGIRALYLLTTIAEGYFPTFGRRPRPATSRALAFARSRGTRCRTTCIRRRSSRARARSRGR